MADSEDRKITRPQPRSAIPRRYARDSRTPAITFTAQCCSQASSGVSKKSLGAKMPALFTRMSAAGSAATSAAQPAAEPTSAATPRSAARGPISAYR